MKNDNSPSWGGKRSGAGRPSTGRSKKQIYVTDEEYTEIKKLIDKLREEPFPSKINSKYYWQRGNIVVT